MSRYVAGQIRVREPGPLVYATDGAVARKKHRKEWQTGWGYLSTHGHYGAGWCPQPPVIAGHDVPAVAELRAVWYAVGERLPSGPVVVLLDSQTAVAFIERWKAGRVGLPPGYLGSQKHTPRIAVLADAVRRHGHNLTSMWVPGHSGHLLNEAADSLAKMGSRWMLDNLTSAAIRTRATRLVTGFLADPHIWDAA